MLSPSSFLLCRPVHGLIFLYKWRAEEEPQGSIVKDSRLEEIFFAKQVGHVATFHSFSTANTSDGQLAGAGNKAIGQTDVMGFSGSIYILFPSWPLQVIHNACATQAILSVLLNTKHSDVDFGAVLTEFKDFAISFDPAVRLPTKLQQFYLYSTNSMYSCVV